VHLPCLKPLPLLGWGGTRKFKHHAFILKKKIAGMVNQSSEFSFCRTNLAAFGGGPYCSTAARQPGGVVWGDEHQNDDQMVSSPWPELFFCFSLCIRRTSIGHVGLSVTEAMA